jgi:uncharacterized protein YyaL (SSP411 family)
VRLALDLYASSDDAAMLRTAVRALDAMGWRGLWDAEDGGFFRYCAGRDWTQPQREKLLPQNAALLDLYLHAAETIGGDRWLARARDTLAFIERTLQRRDGAWRFSAHADASRVFADATALACSALLHAARLFEDERLGRHSLETLERVLLATYKPGEGVAHFGGGVRGLLTDQIAMAAASLDAWDATGGRPYRMMAEELVEFAIRTMWRAEPGGFLDRGEQVGAGDPADAARPLVPYVLNCDAAVVLARLSRDDGGERFAEYARETLRAIAPAAASYGPLAAHYLLARRAVLR